jgi:DNA (cytosine-5)-methyltransferase 1
MKLKLLDLFSGIGGFSLGLESTGFFETIGFVEKDKFCQKVLKKHWSNINIEEDIRNVKGERYAADIITGGFPCQPFSVAGKRKSTADDRYLWDEMLRVIREVKPRWIIGENVEGIININEGMVLRQVQTDLEKEGFQSQCIIIPASGIGAWHQRKRVWIVANSSSKRSLAQSIGVNRELEKEIGGKKEARNQSSLCTSSSCSNVSNSDSIRHGRWCSEGCSNGEWSFFQRKQERCEMGSEVKGCDGNVSNSNGEGSQGYKLQHIMETGEQISEHNGKTSLKEQQTWWQTESEFCGVPNGVSYELDKDRTNRIKSLGNSIVPQIARELGLAIMKAELNGKRNIF